MNLIVLATIALLAGGFFLYRLRKSSAADDTLRGRLRTAQDFYDAVRNADNKRWIVRKARNDVYFRKLDVRLKTWNPVVRKVMYLLAGVMFTYGIVLFAIALSQRGIIP